MPDSATATPPVAATQNTPTTINTSDSKLLVKVVTDKDKLVREERVLLVLPDGTTHERRTDQHGAVRFDSLPLPPATAVYLVLPDVLERWSDTLPFEVQLTRFGASYLTADAGDTLPRGEIDAYRGSDKDQIDKLERVASDGLNEKQLAAANKAARDEKRYRSKDRTKYLVRTAAPAAQDAWIEVTIRIDMLTAAEKFAHIREVFEDNKAWYTAGRLNYSPAERRWFASGGAVCNQWANLFLGYWVNHNNAYTGGASSTDFLRQMNNDSIRDRASNTYRYRGFADVRGAPLPVPANKDSDSYTKATLRDGTRVRHTYTKIEDGDLAEVGGQWRFTNGWQDQLATYNVYSMSTNKGKSTLIFDHHGGLLINDPTEGLLTFSADGYKKANGAFSHTPLVVKKPTGLDQASRTRDLHLIVWPLRDLRPGGYAALDGDAGEYRTDAEMAAQNAAAASPSTIHPDFCHSLSRFMYWRGAANP